MIQRYSHAELLNFSAALLRGAGLELSRANTISEVLLEGDLLGHHTHGLQLLIPYLDEIERERMSIHGKPGIISDSGSAITWDGNYLPGPWLVTQALNLALDRIATHPVTTVVIRRSHHIACLASYLKRATDLGFVMLLMSSDPSNKSVSPFGGTSGILAPNPIAAGFPTNDDPVLIDISASTTTVGMTSRLHSQNKRLPGDWLIDHDGNPSDDPGVLFGETPGAIQPLGGIDLGHKGFGMALLVEALTSALGGFGRADGASQWGASVFLQLINPSTFGTQERFLRETSWLVQACRRASTSGAQTSVRMPGERGLARRREQLCKGIEIQPDIMESLISRAQKMGVRAPIII